MAIDKITLEILKNHTRAAAESMAFTLYRTAHSTFVKETEDFTTGLTTPTGETFATPTYCRLPSVERNDSRNGI